MRLADFLEGKSFSFLEPSSSLTCLRSSLYNLSSHRLQFTDSDLDYFTNMLAHSMRPSQLYQKKSACKEPSNPPLSVRNLNVGNDKHDTKTCKHDLALQLLIIVDG